MTFTHPVLVRWSDIDSYDHVNHGLSQGGGGLKA